MPIPHGTVSGYSWHKCRCDLCVEAKRSKDRSYYLRNAEKVRRRVQAHYFANREEIGAQNKRYREANADKIKAQRQIYEEAHRAEAVARAKAWVKANPERYKEHTARHREKYREQRRVASMERYRRLMAENPEKVRKQRREWAKSPKGKLYYRNSNIQRRRGVPYTKEALEWIGSLIDPDCEYCNHPATTIDHVIPISRGGTGDLQNLVPACQPCNASKGNQTLEEFLAKKKGTNAMATICAHCGSADTQAGLDQIQCTNCGRVSTFGGDKAEAGAGASTREALEARLAPRTTVVGGNYADLQRMGGEAAVKGKGTLPPGVEKEDVSTAADAEAERGEFTRETERTGQVKAPEPETPAEETDKQEVTNTAPTGGRAPGSVTNVSTGAEVKSGSSKK